MVGRIEMVFCDKGKTFRTNSVDAVAGKGHEVLSGADEREDIGLAGDFFCFPVAGTDKALWSGNINSGRVDVQLPVRRHVVQKRGLQHGYHSSGGQAAEPASAFLPVFKKDVVGRQVRGTQL